MPQPSSEHVDTVAHSIDATETGFIIRKTPNGEVVHVDHMPMACCTKTNIQRAVLWLSDRIETMTPTEYEAASAVFAIYPEHAVSYPFLGLAGESGELIAAMHATILKPVNKNDVLKELGDVCWYYADICRKTGHTLSKIIDMEGQHDVSGVVDATHELVVTVGSISELAKKALRDDGGQWTDARRAKIEVALRRLATIILAIRRKYGFPLSDVFQANIAKLSSRQQRNKINGDGDNR